MSGGASARTERARRLGVAGAVLLVVATTGCVRGCKSRFSPIHPNPNMDYQGKSQPQESSDFFYDGSAMRLPVPGTVARGELNEDTAFQTGKDAAGAFLALNPVGDDEATLARGAERYAIFCRPCHDKRGNGQGILYLKGGVPTASFHDPKFAAYVDGQLFDVITNGLGLMKGYAYPIPPDDRWAIVRHVRRLQQEQRERQVALATEGGR